MQAPYLAVEIYGFRSVDFIFGILLAFAAIMLMQLGVTVIFLVVKAGRVPTIRLKTTREEPELTLAKGQKFHLFNSQ